MDEHRLEITTWKKEFHTLKARLDEERTILENVKAEKH